ncbi:DUF2332 domain-containing protein [Paenibacillus sp. N3/727]|uniref:DUF2332 domain-containing protein n=1 Tax=Paenibacillus sp. N3/727 TaxID=2925845 RepID=UPI001F53AF91|nr:DUF2332 domain-containing protein [Paenibacillus sp. N3/727]UNK21208.1 DUF2332 domain-containing protein [Paenibacillus sp. N3/727]
MMDKNQLSKRFIQFAAECQSSTLYEHLSLHIAEDPELLELSSYAQKGQPMPNLFFGAVHYLLLNGKEHSLKNFYPSLEKQPETEGVFTHFKDFCLAHRGEIIPILERKLVQTNEVRRCAYLYPSFCYIYDKVKKPLALIEIGTSSGLQLLWDQFSYSYGTGITYGNPRGTVHITSEIKGDSTPLLLDTAPPVSVRIGVDLHVNDVSNPEDKQWLQALIWPEHHERRELFARASQCVQETPIQLIEGDGVALLTQLIDQISTDSLICVFHTHVANQIPKEAKKRLTETIQEIGSTRDIAHLYNNMNDGDLHLDYVLNGKTYNHTLGATEGHGRWFEWNIVD